MSDRPRRPGGLKAPGARLWADIVNVYELRPDELRLLEHAARTVDLIEAMGTRLSAESMMVAGSTGQERAHPLLTEIRGHRTLLATLLKQLGLPDEHPVTATRRGQKAAASRWGHGA